MNAKNSVLENFSRMIEEFNSCNNRMNRDVSELYEHNLKDLLSSLDYLNEEYGLFATKVLHSIFNDFEKNISEIKVTHDEKIIKKFNKNIELLKDSMSNFFINKLVKEDNGKKKMSNEVKHFVDNLCDYHILELEEELDNFIYNFKINFEMKHINDEYCKDDFNKIMRSFEHSLISDIRNEVVTSIGEKQDIVSRYALKAYNIVDDYKKMKR